MQGERKEGRDGGGQVGGDERRHFQAPRNFLPNLPEALYSRFVFDVVYALEQQVLVHRKVNDRHVLEHHHLRGIVMEESLR